MCPQLIKDGLLTISGTLIDEVFSFNSTSYSCLHGKLCQTITKIFITTWSEYSTSQKRIKKSLKWAEYHQAYIHNGVGETQGK